RGHRDDLPRERIVEGLGEHLGQRIRQDAGALGTVQYQHASLSLVVARSVGYGLSHRPDRRLRRRSRVHAAEGRQAGPARNGQVSVEMSNSDSWFLVISAVTSAWYRSPRFCATWAGQPSSL